MNRISARSVQKPTAMQRLAADPGKNIWLTASAGSGKTKVLTDRVLTLLLQGTAPENILCLTFTKAAAAEMADRVTSRLAEWAAMSKPELMETLFEALGRRPVKRELEQAQCLFALVLDSPNGLNIQTIHSFCQSLIARFPFEAGVPPHFEIMEEERTAVELRRRARDNVLGTADNNKVIRQSLLVLTRHIQENQFDDLINEIIQNRSRLAHGIFDSGGVQNAINRLHSVLNVNKTETVSSICKKAIEQIDEDILSRAANALLQGSEKTDKPIGRKLLTWLAGDIERKVENFDELIAIFIAPATGTVRSKILTNVAQKSDPDLENLLQAEGAQLLRVREKTNAVTTAGCTAALLQVGAAFLEEYDRLKRRLGRLDYNDLIYLTRALLTRAGIAPWVLFKLDGGIDHILIDEAQDTNSAQWQIVEALVAEFFSGEGANKKVRTLFAVGDVKQSIFSFQGAEPKQFERFREVFANQARAAQRDWEDLDLSISFRSVDAVLAVVDSVFSLDAAKGGVVEDGKPLKHKAFRRGQAGLVELWPPLGVESGDPSPAWTLPLKRVFDEKPSRRLASALAEKISALIGSETLLSRGRPIKAGDFMILLRKRSGFMKEIIAELKAREVAVAGVDRVKLGEQLAVMDLIALGRFLLLPEDDLNLAIILKSPLIGLEDDSLYELARDRAPLSLWERIRKRSDRNYSLKNIVDWLGGLLTKTGMERPYELFSFVLSAPVPAGGSGREAMLRRLGPECEDPMDVFLNFAISYEQDHPPSLEGFLHWMEAGEVETKRDLDQGTVDEVRVMTVHGAKGLQAPIVILPDTISKNQKTDNILWHGSLPLWSPRRSLEPKQGRNLRNAARDAQDKEERRLLYVAMTRAEDRLYVCGYRSSRNKIADDCWFALIRDGLADLAEASEFDFGKEVLKGWEGKGIRLQTEQRVPIQMSDSTTEENDLKPLPSWAKKDAPIEAIPQKSLVPSKIEEDTPAPSPLVSASGNRFLRGILIHRMLQALPSIHPEDREKAIERFLVQNTIGLTEIEKVKIAGNVKDILNDTQFKRLFSVESRAEVPLIGRVHLANGPQVISGQIDRLVVSNGEVLAVDYKTLRFPPLREEDIPVGYMRQMAAYRALLRGIWPGRIVKCALLWTESPSLMWLNDVHLNAFVPDP